MIDLDLYHGFQTDVKPIKSVKRSAQNVGQTAARASSTIASVQRDLKSLSGDMRIVAAEQPQGRMLYKQYASAVKALDTAVRLLRNVQSGLR